MIHTMFYLYYLAGDSELVVPLLESSMPLFQLPSTNIHYYHITEAISISTNTINYISSKTLTEITNTTSLSLNNNGYEAFTDGIVSGTKTVIKDMFGSIMGKFS